MAHKNPPLTEAVVCFIVRGKKIMLAKKKTKIGKGLWNGYGGLREDDDVSIERAVAREVEEETDGIISINLKKLKKIAIVSYHNDTDDVRRKKIRVHFYTYEWTGKDPKESKAMGTPQWFAFDKVPYEEMLPSDKDWMPQALLSGDSIAGNVHHDDKENVVKSEFTAIDAFSKPVKQ